MNNFWKGFSNLFDWMIPRTTKEQLDDLDNSMQDLYDRMGWGKYNSPIAAYNTATDINRVLEAEKEFNNAVDNYLYRSKQQMITYYYHNPIIKDPARRRINKYL